MKTILWAIRHPRFALHWLRFQQPYPHRDGERHSLRASDCRCNKE